MNKSKETEADEEQQEHRAVILSWAELQYLSDKEITETDPMVYIAWHSRNLTDFIQAAAGGPAPPRSCRSSPLMSSE